MSQPRPSVDTPANYVPFPSGTETEVNSVVIPNGCFATIFEDGGDNDGVTIRAVMGDGQTPGGIKLPTLAELDAVEEAHNDFSTATNATLESHTTRLSDLENSAGSAASAIASLNTGLGDAETAISAVESGTAANAATIAANATNLGLLNASAGSAATAIASLNTGLSDLNTKVGADATGNTITVSTLAEAQALSGAMLFDDVEMTFNSSNVDYWQDMIDAMPKAGNGKNLTITIADGSYSQSISIADFTGFYNITVCSATTPSSGVSQPVTLNGANSTLWVKNVLAGKIELNGIRVISSATIAINIENVPSYTILSYCSAQSAVAHSSYGAVYINCCPNVNLSRTYFGGVSASSGAYLNFSRALVYNCASDASNLPAYGVRVVTSSIASLGYGTWPNGSTSGAEPATANGGLAIDGAGVTLP